MKLNFSDLQVAVSNQLSLMTQRDTELFVVDVSRDELWELYLNSFPEGTNPMYKERTEHDCQCCKNFIRDCGAVVTISDGQLVSVWDVDITGPYAEVVSALSAFVKTKSIHSVFRHRQSQLGVHHNFGEDGVRWEHFSYKLPEKYVAYAGTLGTVIGRSRSDFHVFRRAVNDLTVDALQTTIDLIKQNSIYRGEEFLALVETFLDRKLTYDEIPVSAQDRYCWETSARQLGSVTNFRNSVIGTLVTDLSEGMELDKAVALYESKVAPENYQRPTALVTPRMIAAAESTVQELGLIDALPRRFATARDLTINNVLFADRSIQKELSVFDTLAKQAGAVTNKAFDKLEEVSIDVFLKDILPNIESMQILVENRHQGNFVSLIAPAVKGAPHLFKWDNGFSWSYNGEVADSIRERVKTAGGNVNGILRCSLAWYNYDDLDIHVVEPSGNRIYFSNPRSSTSGTLDVDMNAGSGRSRTPVENIVWTNASRMQSGTYELRVCQYSRRESIDVGCELEIEHQGKIIKFAYNQPVSGTVMVAKFHFDPVNGVKIIQSIPSSVSSRDLWGISTETFHPVNMVLNSPNHWDGHMVGNRHVLFMLDKCINPEPARGFYNEFLTDKLRQHRKVFEVLGAKMKTPLSNDQLSGLGFSTTKKTSIICKVAGSFTRTLKIIF